MININLSRTKGKKWKIKMKIRLNKNKQNKMNFYNIINSKIKTKKIHHNQVRI